MNWKRPVISVAQWMRYQATFMVGFSLFLSLGNLRSGEPSPLPPNILTNLSFTQNLNQLLPLNEKLRDETGQKTSLGNSQNGQPAILVLGYYACPMLCHSVLNALLKGMNDLKQTAGKDFSVIFVSIDPHETSQLAAAKRASYLRHYDRPGAEKGWHFLTGDEGAVQRIAAAAGFPYAYDATVQQYAHPAGIIILTPEGHISRYLLGVNYSPKELNDALLAASNQQISNPVKDLLLLCFHYNPITGKYGSLIMTSVRVFGLLTLVSLGWFILRSIRPKLIRDVEQSNKVPKSKSPALEPSKETP